MKLQAPTPVTLTVLPETVQLPEAAKLTGRPELAVALTGKVAPTILLAMVPNGDRLSSPWRW